MFDDRLALLEATVAALRSELTELRDQLAVTRAGGFRSIRDSRRCPACAGGAIFHVRRVRELAHINKPTEMALVQEPSFWGPKQHGPLEAYACRTCGLVEWHAVDFEGVTPDGENVIAIDPEPDAPKLGPFR
jgi:hypothetical protein